jgi:quinol monooxygenase YgiN
VYLGAVCGANNPERNIISRAKSPCQFTRRNQDHQPMEFVPYIKASEPGTRMYMAWQQKDDPTRFVHFFIFENEAAHKAHSQSEAVRRFGQPTDQSWMEAMWTSPTTKS